MSRSGTKDKEESCGGADKGKFYSGLSGSLTQLTDGSSYLEAGENITITSASNGAVTISSDAGVDGAGAATRLAYWADTDTLMSRIKNRNRDFEKDISSEYIHSLNIYYDKWINSLNKKKVLIVNTNSFNIYKDIHKLESIINSIKDKVGQIK